MTQHSYNTDPTRADRAASSSVTHLELLNAEQLGRLLHLGSGEPGSARAALNLRISRGHALPHCVQIPGSKARYWRLETVVAWLIEQEVPINPVRRGRGRPTKLKSVLKASRMNNLSQSEKRSVVEKTSTPSAVNGENFVQPTKRVPEHQDDLMTGLQRLTQWGCGEIVDFQAM